VQYVIDQLGREPSKQELVEYDEDFRRDHAEAQAVRPGCYVDPGSSSYDKVFLEEYMENRDILTQLGDELTIAEYEDLFPDVETYYERQDRGWAEAAERREGNIQLSENVGVQAREALNLALNLNRDNPTREERSVDANGSYDLIHGEGTVEYEGVRYEIDITEVVDLEHKGPGNRTLEVLINGEGGGVFDLRANVWGGKPYDLRFKYIDSDTSKWVEIESANEGIYGGDRMKGVYSDKYDQLNEELDLVSAVLQALSEQDEED